MTSPDERISFKSITYGNGDRAKKSDLSWNDVNIPQNEISHAQTSSVVHLVTGNDFDRATRARLLFSLGYHAEVYANIGELLAHAPNTGIVFLREDNRGQALKCASLLREKNFWLPIIAYYDDISIEVIISGIKGGVQDYIADSLPPEVLNKRIESVFYEANLKSNLNYVQKRMSDLLDLLTSREKSVLSLLSEGLTSKEIARKFEISPRTIEIHRHRILKKLSAKTTIHAILIYYRSKNGQEL